MIKSAIYNPEEQFIEAEGFLRIVQCGIRGNQEDWHLRMTLINTVVCYSFACEIFLKCIHNIIAKRNTGGHELKELFDNLPNKDMNGDDPHDIIKSLYKDNANSMLCFIKKRFKSPTGNIPYKIIDFNEMLLRVNDNFKQWRYSYESDQLDTVGLGELCYALRDYLITLNPSFSKYINFTSAQAFHIDQ